MKYKLVRPPKNTKNRKPPTSMRPPTTSLGPAAPSASDLLSPAPAKLRGSMQRTARRREQKRHPSNGKHGTLQKDSQVMKYKWVRPPKNTKIRKPPTSMHPPATSLGPTAPSASDLLSPTPAKLLGNMQRRARRREQKRRPPLRKNGNLQK